MKKILVLLAAASLLIPISVYAESTLALQGKCREGAQKFVERVSNVSSFTNHYNKKLDKCFILVTFNFADSKDRGRRRLPEYTVQLLDAFEGTVIGSFSSVDDGICFVRDKPCKSFDEFEALIKPYMEE